MGRGLDLRVSLPEQCGRKGLNSRKGAEPKTMQKKLDLRSQALEVTKLRRARAIWEWVLDLDKCSEG